MGAPLFVAILAACVAIACLTRNEPLRRTGIVMLGVWAFFTLWRTTVEPDNQWPWLLYAAGAAPPGCQLLFVDSADQMLKRKDSSGNVVAI